MASMPLKFSVGVSKPRADRLLLERRRQSLRPRGLGAERDPEQRAPGWPAPGAAEETESDAPAPPHWAW
jgi:hypothetical protein